MNGLMDRQAMLVQFSLCLCLSLSATPFFLVSVKIGTGSEPPSRQEVAKSCDHISSRLHRYLAGDALTGDIALVTEGDGIPALRAASGLVPAQGRGHVGGEFFSSSV